MNQTVTQFGYVLRYVHNLDGKLYFEVPRNGVSTRTIGNINVLTLAEANARLEELYDKSRDNLHRELLPFRKLIRVQRVRGDDRWRLATPDEADQFAYSYEYNTDDAIYRFAPRENKENAPIRHLRIRVPGEPRWEVVDE